MNWDYIAGFFDGEGHLVVKPYKDKHGHFRKVTVGFTQAEEGKEILFAIKDFLEKEGFHPSLRCEKDRRDKRGYKLQPKWRLELQSIFEVKRFCEIVRDKLIYKRRKVEDAIAFIDATGLKHIRRRFTEDEKRRMKELYLEGYSTLSIGEMFGVSYNVIRRLLKEMSVSLRPPNAWTDRAKEKLKATLSSPEVKEKTRASHQKPKIEKVCLVCGRRFYVLPSRIKRRPAKFCSRRCYYESRKRVH
jgi:transposase-like protein